MVAEWKALSLGPDAGKRERKDVQKRSSTWNTSVLFTLTLNLKKIYTQITFSIHKDALYVFIHLLNVSQNIANFYICYSFLSRLLFSHGVLNWISLPKGISLYLLWDKLFTMNYKQKYHMCNAQTEIHSKTGIKLFPFLIKQSQIEKCQKCSYWIYMRYSIQYAQAQEGVYLAVVGLWPP